MKGEMHSEILQKEGRHNKTTRNIIYIVHNLDATWQKSAKIKTKQICPCAEPSTTPWRRMGSGGIAPFFLNVGTRWKWVVSFTPGERAPGVHRIGGWVDPRIALDAVASFLSHFPYAFFRRQIFLFLTYGSF